MILGVLAMCMFDFVWRIYETMLAEEVCFFIVVFNVFGTCVLPRPFLSPPTGHLCRVQVSLYNACVEIG